MKLRRTWGRTEARFCWMAAADRIRCGGSVRESAAAATCVWKSPCVQVGNMEVSSHKKKTPRGCCRGEAGSNISTEEPLRTAVVRDTAVMRWLYVRLSSPGFKVPARFDGKLGT